MIVINSKLKVDSVGHFKWQYVYIIGVSLNCFLSIFFKSNLIVYSLLFFNLSFGAYLIYSHKHYFLEFLFTIWVTGAFVRRFIDYQLGLDVSRNLLLTPYLLILFMVPTLIKRINRSNLGVHVLVMIPVTAYYLAGLYHSGVSDATHELLNYLCPVVFGVWLIQNYSNVDIGRFVNFITLIMSILISYGFYQFIAIPSWDVYWMLNTTMASIGSPAAYEVRVFSLLNSPALLAGFIIFSMCLILYRNTNLWIIPFSLALLAITEIRVAWGMAACMLLVWQLRASFSIKVKSLSLILLFLVSSPIFLPDDIIEKFNSRIDTIRHIDGDHSLLERFQQYDIFINQDLSFWGAGFGASGVYSVNDYDSGLIEILNSLGVAFGAPLIFSIFLFVLILFEKKVLVQKKIYLYLFIALTCYSSVFDSYFVGFFGCMLWFIGVVYVKEDKYE